MRGVLPFWVFSNNIKIFDITRSLRHFLANWMLNNEDDKERKIVNTLVWYKMERVEFLAAKCEESCPKNFFFTFQYSVVEN